MDTRIAPQTATLVNPRATGIAGLLQMPMRSKLLMGAATLALTALVAWGVNAGRQPDWKILYASLGDKDGGAVIAALTQLNVPHKFSESGGAILVPADQVHEARLRLASQGLPKGGTVGFELVENQKFGTTQFQERLNFQRGLEGELARSIMALQAVQSARVHLALPAQTAFLREQQKPSASVLLTLYGGRSLERNQIAGIVHLIASSVPEMAPQAVSVVDQNGTLLSQAPGEKAAGLDAPQLQYVRQTEQGLSQRIIAILEPIVGAGNVRAQVAADIDFTQSESTAELYTPNQGAAPAAVRSQHLSETPGSGAGAAAGGIAGTLANQPPATPASPVNGAPQALAATASGNGAKRDAVTNYEVDKTVKVVRNATGNVKRLSAAVLVNHSNTVGKDGKPVISPLAAAQMEQINALVREAIGFSKDRGDSVQVVNAPFTVPANEKATDLPLWRQPETLEAARSLAPWIALPIVALIIVFGLVRPAMRGARGNGAPRMLAATVEDPIALDSPAEALAMGGDGTQPALLPTAQAARQQARTAQLESIRQIAKQDPATVANVVRNWASQPT